MGKKFVRIMILILAIGAFTYFAINLGKGETSTGVGEKAYNFELEDMEGNTVHLSDFEGKVTVINFFATWCGPCVDEAPELEAFDQEYGKDYKLLIIDLGETRDRVQKFIDKENTTSTYLFDFKQEVKKKYGVVGQPETFIIDKDGVIRDQYKGPLTKAELYEMASKYN